MVFLHSPGDVDSKQTKCLGLANQQQWGFVQKQVFVVTVVALAMQPINFGGVASKEAMNGGLYLFSRKDKNQWIPL